MPKGNPFILVRVFFKNPLDKKSGLMLMRKKTLAAERAAKGPGSPFKKIVAIRTLTDKQAREWRDRRR